MQKEPELTPFAPGRLDGSPVLVLAPHPDDEVFGCGGVLVQAVTNGSEVQVVVLTDGGAQGDPEVRRQEAAQAAVHLGLPPPRFWELADRSLDPTDGTLRERLRQLLLELRPCIILAPSPAELHPDHRALALVIYRLLQEATVGSELHDAVQAARLVAYEVSSVLRPNLLVDVSEQWQTVIKAATAYHSQVEQMPYLEVLQGVATARRLTLPASVRWAEAYHVVDLRYIRTHSAAEWAAEQGPSARLEPASATVPIDLVVRTRNRPQLLAQALDSVLTQLLPPARVIVVNDGGVEISHLCERLDGRCQWEVVQHAQALGRARAAQAGLERASASHVVLLDDDDLLLPEHLLTLAQAVAEGATVPYTDAVQGVWSSDPATGALQPVARHRTFGGGFAADRFALINHIPLLTVALPRELALEVGGFDAKLDLYEDWDLLLRLAERTPFVHIPRVTCEYRILPETGGITGANPPGSSGQLNALVSIWRRHGLTRRSTRLAAGVMALLAERDRAAEQLRLLDEQLISTVGEREGLRAEGARLQQEQQRLSRRNHGLQAELERHEVTELELRDEIKRLTGLLERIYSSTAWKLHLVAERLRGRPTR